MGMSEFYGEHDEEESIKIIHRADEVFLSPVILGELLAGFLGGKREKKNKGILDDVNR